MIEVTNKDLNKIINDIPEHFKVIDIGGASEPLKRADYLVDIVPYEKIYFERAKGPGEIRFNKDSFIQQDICDKKPLPFEDKFFDFSFCSHVLEDIRDPLQVCSELIRISKAGYIEVPSRIYETTFGLEAKNLAGSSHHRWVIDINNNKLRFTFKYFYIHSSVLNKNKKKKNRNNPEMLLKILWKENFEYYENWLNSGKEIFEYYLDKQIQDKEMWRIFRKTQDRNFFIKWLAYFKNISKYFN